MGSFMVQSSIKCGKNGPLTYARWKDLTPTQPAKYRKNRKCNSAVPAYKEHELVTLNKVTIATHLRDTVKNNEIQSVKFFVISFNYFIVTDLEKVHLPAEVSICAYSIEDGLIKVYSKRLNPKANLFGYFYLAHENAKQTHMLPLPPQALGTNNLKQVYEDIIKFMQKYSDETSQDSNALPPLYTKMEKLHIAKSCLAYMWNLAPHQPEISVYSIEYLGDEIKTFTKKVTNDDYEYDSCEKDFEKDCYEYQEELACPYHERVDRGKYCSQHQVVRWTYTMNNYLAKYFDINMIQVKHYPVNNSILLAKDSVNSDKDSEDPVKIHNVTGTGTSTGTNGDNSSNTECERSKFDQKGLASSSRNPIQVNDILKVIYTANCPRGNPKNKQKKKVSDFLLSKWSTKAPNSKLLGYGRGHP